MNAWAQRRQFYKATALFPFEGSAQRGELSVAKGDVFLCKEETDGWCHCFTDQGQGYVPRSYLALELSNASLSSPSKKQY